MFIPLLIGMSVFIILFLLIFFIRKSVTKDDKENKRIKFDTVDGIVLVSCFFIGIVITFAIVMCYESKKLNMLQQAAVIHLASEDLNHSDFKNEMLDLISNVSNSNDDVVLDESSLLEPFTASRSRTSDSTPIVFSSPIVRVVRISTEAQQDPNVIEMPASGVQNEPVPRFAQVNRITSNSIGNSLQQQTQAPQISSFNLDNRTGGNSLSSGKSVPFTRSVPDVNSSVMATPVMSSLSSNPNSESGLSTSVIENLANPGVPQTLVN